MFATLNAQIKGVDTATADASKFAQAVDSIDDTIRAAAKSGDLLEEQFEQLSQSLNAARAAFASGQQDMAQYADGFGELIKQMQAFKKEQAALAQSNVVGGSLDGKGRGELEKMSTDDLRAYIAIDDARAVNSVAVARQIVKARESEANAAEKEAARQEAARKKQVDSEVANLDRLDAANKEARAGLGNELQRGTRENELRSMTALQAAGSRLAETESKIAENQVKGVAAAKQLADARGFLAKANAGDDEAKQAQARAAVEKGLERQTSLINERTQLLAQQTSQRAKYATEQRRYDEAESRAATQQIRDAKRTADAKIAETRREARERERAAEKSRSEQVRAERTAAKENEALARATTGRDSALRDAGYGQQAREAGELAAVTSRLRDTERSLVQIRQQLANTGISKGQRTALLQEETRLIRQQTSALQEQQRIQDEASRSLENHRFALYEVATAYGVASGALFAMGSGAVKAFAQYESGMTSVERTSGLIGDQFTGELQELEGQLLEMSDTIPTTTGDILDMAARAGQLGVASDEIAGFTDSISKFVAISDTVSATDGAEAFGRIANLTGNRDWEELASMIALAGVNSAATDQQILKTAQEIAQAGAAANYSSDQIIGLAAAFASLGVPPERARSVMQDLNKVMNKSLAGMNDSLAKSADLMGITADEAANLWQTDSGAFFQQFVKGLSSVDNLTVTLSDLGLEGARAQPVMAALTQDYLRNAEGASVLSTALSDTASQVGEATALQEQYAPLLDDLNSKWIMLTNTFGTTAAAIGGTLAPMLGTMADAFADILVGVREFVTSPIGGAITEWILRIAGLSAGLLAMRGALFLATAWAGALSASLKMVGGAGMLAQLKNIALALGIMRPAAAGSATAVWSLRAALLGLGRATVILGIIQLAMELLFNFSGVARGAGDVLIWLADTFQGAANFIASALQAIGGAVAGLGRMLGLPAQVMDQLDSLNNSFGLGGSGLKQYGAQLHQWADSMDAAADTANGSEGAIGDISTLFEDIGETGLDAEEGAGGAADGIEDAGDAAEAAAPKLRTLIDYASELSQVWNRAFEIRFSGSQTFDAITSSMQRIAKETRESERAMRDLQDRLRSLNADMSGLQSELGIQQYFLGIAVEYGDTERAGAIQANIAKLQADIASKQTETAKTTEDLKMAQDANSKSLVGNSEAAIKNRTDILALVTAYQAHLEALAKSGMGADELAAATQALKQDFIAQASQLGYNSGELGIYAAAFDDVAFAIANIPRNVDIDVNVNPALMALQELRASLQDTLDAANGLSDSLGGGGGFPSYPSVPYGGGPKKKEKLTPIGKVPKPTYMPQNTAPENNPTRNTPNWLDGFGKFWSEANKILSGGKPWEVVQEQVDQMAERSKGSVTSAGNQIGWNISSSVHSGVSSTINPYGLVNDKITTPIITVGSPLARSAGDSIGRSVGDGVNAAPYDASPIASRISQSLAAQGPILRGAGTAAGNAVSGGLSSANYGNVGAQVAGAVSGSMYNALGSLFNAGYAAGQAVGSGTRSGLVNFLRENPLRTSTSAIRRPGTSSVTGLGIDFYANGGYTGPGHKYEEAGIVHRGEYVIPKQDVNQATGMPYADALGRAHRGSGPSQGYRNGGYVSGGSGSDIMELGPASIHAIARAVQPNISLDGRVVAESSSQQYARSTRKGSS